MRLPSKLSLSPLRRRPLSSVFRSFQKQSALFNNISLNQYLWRTALPEELKGRFQLRKANYSQNCAEQLSQKRNAEYTRWRAIRNAEYTSRMKKA